MQRQTLLDLVLHHPEERLDEQALVFLNQEGEESSSFTYADLIEKCQFVAQNLSFFSNERELVFLALDNQAQFVQGFFGCIMAGKIPAPMPSIQNARNKAGWGRLVAILQKNPTAALMISEEQYGEILDRLKANQLERIRIYPFESLTRPTLVKQTLVIPDPKSVAYIQYTSGSTSMPKGIMLTHEQVLANLDKMYHSFNREALVRVAGWIPFHHDMGLVGHLFTALFESGSGVFLPPSAFLAKPKIWLKAIQTYKANSAAAPTFAFEYCVRKVKDLEGLDLASWKYAYVGSETVAIETLDKFAEKFASVGFDRNTFRPVYGLAEVTLLAAGGHKGLNDLQSSCLKRELSSGINRILVPYTISENTSISIHDIDTKKECDNGVIGEVWIESPGNYIGYLDQINLNVEGEIQLVKTGDLGFIQDGMLYLTGRSQERLIIRGVNYAAEDLEYCVRIAQTNLRSNDTTVCIQYAEEVEDKLLVFQEVQRHLSLDVQKTIVNQIKANFSEYFGINPSTIVLLPQGLMPRTSNYKVSRTACLEQFLSGKLRTLYTSGKQIIKQNVKTEKEDDPVVIIGMACRFPGGADTLDKFWTLLSEGQDAIVTVPEDRWDNSLFYDENPNVPGKVNTNWGGFIDKIDHFDPGLFGISGYEAAEIDPQQRLVLETSWRLIENTGWKKQELGNSSTGVFIGISTNDYLYTKIKLTPGLEGFNAYAGLGNAHSVAANRVSYYYDLKGPSMAIDTACSSSLTAFHLGSQAILNGDCEQAIVGGVNAIISPGSTVTLSQFGMMAPDGRCKTFDASADGYVRSEGCGLVMLKRKSAAIKDGDQILATVIASTAAQDGASPGITYPNGDAQRKLIQNTLAKAEIDGVNISYVEAHGTGTSSGDPVEMEQIAALYGREAKTICHVGSVKANIGHLESSAGIAGLIKTVLMLQQKQIPPQIHLNELNSKINLKGTRLQIPTSLTEWKISDGQKRIAAISSFGFGGSLAHAILEEPSDIVAPTSNIPGDHLKYPFVLSAHSPDALQQQAQSWANWLGENPTIPFPDMAYTQAMTRSDLPYRMYSVVSDKRELADQLTRFVGQKRSSKSTSQVNELCFLLTGQGENYPLMGRSLYHRFPVFQRCFDQCINSVGDKDLIAKLRYIAYDSTDREEWEEKYIQPVLFATQYALANFLMDLGLSPSYFVGYSFGEYVAGCLAGCYSFETGMQMVYKRGLLLDGIEEQGHMVTIFTDHEAIRAIMDEEKVSIAVVNSKKKTVVSGDPHEIKRLCDHFKEQDIDHYYLRTMNAYHSEYVSPIMEEYGQFLDTLVFTAPTGSWLSSVSGEWMKTAPTSEHWLKQLRETVWFTKAAEKLPLPEKNIHFIEVGPGASTLAAIHDHLSPKGSLLLRTMVRSKRTRTEDFYITDSLGRLYEAGFDLNWDLVYNAKLYPKHIPGFQFQHRPYWIRGMDASKLSAFASNLGYEQGATVDNPSLNKQIASGGHVDDEQLHYTMSWHKDSNLEGFDLGKGLKEPINWILIGNDSSLMKEIIKTLRSADQPVFWLGGKTRGSIKPDIELSADPDKDELYKKIDKVVNLHAKQSIEKYKILFIPTVQDFDNEIHSISQLNKEVKQTVGLYTHLFQALKQMVVSAPIWIITQAAQAVDPNELADVRPSLAPLWGFAQTAYLEHPEWRGGIIDTSITESVTGRAKNVLKKIIRPKQERCVVLREGNQYIERIEPAILASDSKTSYRTDGAYIVTGGIGGIGLASAKWLADKGVQHLILISRRELPPQNEWKELDENHPYKAVITELLPLKEQVEKLELISTDVRDINRLQELFDQLDRDAIPVRGVLHAAGVNWFKKIVDLDVNELLETLNIKVASAWALHQMTQHRDLDCFVLFSSVSALWGSSELSHYTAANYYLDVLAKHRHNIGLPALSVDWGPWAEVGMSVREGVKGLDELGFGLMKPIVAIEAMDAALQEGKPLYLIGEVNWDKLKPFVDFSLRPSLFAKLTSDHHSQINLPTTDALLDIYSSPADIARQKIEDVVRMELRRVMLIDTMDHIDEEQRFNFMGMDSLMAISFVVEIEQYFNIKLPNTLPYNYPHIKAVSDYLFEQVYIPNTNDSDSNEQVGQLSTVNGELKSANKEDISLVKGSWVPLIRDAKTVCQHHLYCFPYAGSGVSVFEKFAQVLPTYLTVHGIQPPGREERSSEPPFKTMETLISDLVDHFSPPDEPYSFFGHSFGGVVAYEFYLALERAGKKLPERLILSATNGLVNVPDGNTHKLPDEEMVDEIMQHYENTQDNELRRQAILSIKDLVRADVQIMETHQPHGGRVNVPVIVIAATDDPIAPPKRVKKWLSLVDHDFNYYQLEGKHNLIQQNYGQLAEIIKKTIPSLTYENAIN